MQLDDFHDKTWEHILGVCDTPVLLALSKEDELVEAAKLVEQHGPKAGAAYIVSVLMARKNPMMAINAACHYYQKLAKKHKFDELREKVGDMTSSAAWGGSPYTAPHPTNKWPVKPPEEMLTDSGSMLNFLLFEGLKGLNPESTAVDYLVASGVIDFLGWLNKIGSLRELKRKKVRKRGKVTACAT